MNLESCFLCKRPVLELEGQFEKLDTYLLDEADAAYQQGAFGWCHTRCLSTSDWGGFWAERRIQHMTKVLGFSKIGVSGTLTALRNPRTSDLIVVRADGVTFVVVPSALAQKVDCPDGILLPVSEEINLEFDDSRLAREIRDILVESKPYPLSKLIEALDLTDFLLYPQAISDGALHFDKTLKRDWVDNWVSAIAVYNKFVPQVVLASLRSI